MSGTGGDTGGSAAGGASGSGGTSGNSGTSGSGGNAGGGTSGSGATGGNAGASAGGGSGGQGGDPCDRDNDGQRAASGNCGGLDCADNDADVFDGQPDYFAEPNRAGTYDYDCRNGPEREYTCTVNNCGLLTNCGVAQCFLGTQLPACGQSAPWGTCVDTLPLVCENNVLEPSRIVRCH